MDVQSKEVVAQGQAKSVFPSNEEISVQSVATQTHAIGVIVPPPDIRAIADKTAQFVARSGKMYELLMTCAVFLFL